MNKKVLSYINNTGENKTPLTDVLRFYASGEMESVLSKQHIAKLEFFSTIRKNENSLQISFQYYNLCAILEFCETEYEYSIYTPNCSMENLENSIVTNAYSPDFSIELFLDTFMYLLNSDARLIKIMQPPEKKKPYKVIASACFWLGVFIIAIPSAYVLLTGNTIQLGPWFLGAIFVPFILWQIFKFLSARN